MDSKTEELLNLAAWAESQGWECDGRTVSDGIIRILRGKKWEN